MAHSDFPRMNWLASERLLLAGLLVFTLLVRGVVLWGMRGNLQQDPDAYREIAENLLRHGEFALGRGSPGDDASPVRPTAYRPPLYPVILSNLPATDGEQVSLVKVAGLHLLLGVATVWLTWLTARRLLHAEVANMPSGGPSGLAPLVAAFLVACDPILLNQQTLVMTETLAAFLAILALWCLARFDGCRSWFNAALVGGAIGLAVLCRPAFLPWLGLVGLAMLVVRARNSKCRIQNAEFRIVGQRTSWLSAIGWRVVNLAALVAVATAVISPWVIRNYRVFGKPIATTTHGGYTLYLANNSEFYDYLQSDDQNLPWVPSVHFPGMAYALTDLETTAERIEMQFDRRLNEDAKRTIRAAPATFLQACLYRLRQLWSPLPYKLSADESAGRRLLRYGTAVWYCGVYLLAAIGVWRLRGKLLAPPWMWGVLLCLAFTAVHTFYWTNLRMRAPLIPFVSIVAAAGLTSARFKVRGSKLDAQ